MNIYAIPEGATHFIESNEEDRDHFVVADSAGNISKIYCPDYPGIGWDCDIESHNLPPRALPVASYIEINNLKEKLAKAKEAAVFYQKSSGNKSTLKFGYSRVIEELS